MQCVKLLDRVFPKKEAFNNEKDYKKDLKM